MIKGSFPQEDTTTLNVYVPKREYQNLGVGKESPGVELQEEIG